MPDVSAYPMLRPHARRRRRSLLPRVEQRHLRLVAVLVIALVVLAGAVWAGRPGLPDPARALADARTTFAAGNYHAAKRNAQIAVAASPRLAAAHLMLARAELELDEGLAAEAALGRARQLGTPVAELHHLLAGARLAQGDPTGALEEVTQASARFAGEAERVRAAALTAGGDRPAALTALETLVARQPRDARAWTALARLRLSAGAMGSAADAAATAVRLAPGEPAALTLQGEVIRARFGLVAALPWFEAALARDAYYLPALIEQAATLGDVGRYADALAATRKALVAQPGCPPALYLQAVIAARAGKVELARRLMASAGPAVEGVPGALLLAGSIDAAEGRYEEAAARWRRLLVSQPMNVAVRRLLAGALLRSHDTAAALEVLRPVALRSDADAYALALTARGWEAQGDRVAAANWLDRAGAGARGVAALFATDESVAALQTGAASASGDPTYALGVIRGLMNGGDRAGALAKARALVSAAPRDPAAVLALGDTLSATGAADEAARVYARAADLQFDEPTALRLIAALGRAGRRQDAAAALALYLGQNPQSLTGRRLLGHWQVATGAWGPAIETLEGVRRAGGDRDAGLLADLALAYAGDASAGNGAADVARVYGRAAYRLAPLSPVTADAYGVALAAAGDTAGARQLFDKAVALAPGVPAYLAHRRQVG